MPKDTFISKQFKNKRKLLYLLLMSITLGINLIDIFLLKITPSEPIFYLYLLNISIILILMPGVLLFNISLNRTKVILIYTIFISIIFSQLLKPQTANFEALFLRDIVFIVILLFAGGLFLGRKHILVMGTIFLITYYLKLFYFQNEFLWINSFTIILTVIAFIILLYILITKLENNHHNQNKFISELKEKNMQLDQQQQELVKLNQSKDLFFSILGHDLRNPMQALLGLNEVVQEKLEDGNYTETAYLLGKMEKTTKVTYGLLNDLLMWSYSQTGKIHFTPEPINFHQLITENIVFFENKISTKKINLRLKMSKELLIKADKNMLSAVVRNLLSNAIKFTPIEGSIKIKTFLKSGKLIFTIQDNGKGISPVHLPHLFELGYNHSTTGTLNETGTGFGLVICKDFISKHDGDIWVESVLDYGSTFSFRFPNSFSNLE